MELAWKCAECVNSILSNMNLQNNLSFSLCAVLSVCHVVATSHELMKSEIEVSANWCIAIKHQKLSSVRIIFIDYQTSKLQYNYQPYIQVEVIRDVQGFNGVALITLSKGFSGETLIGVEELCHRRPSWIGISLTWKTRYLDCYITITEICCEKDSYHKRQTYHEC